MTMTESSGAKRDAEEQSLVARLLQRDPKAGAHVTLSVLVESVRAKEAALFRVSNGIATLYLSRDCTQAALDRSLESWSRQSADLMRGRYIMAHDWCLCPIGDPIAGILYLSADPLPASLREDVAAFSHALRFLLVHDGETVSADLDAIAAKTSVREFERRRLTVLLQIHGGNVSAVARAMHMSRPTLYSRLRVHHIHPRLAQQ